jgi:hypothetical protein
MIHLFEQCADLNILCIAGVEVINVAIEYTGIDKCVLQIRKSGPQFSRSIMTRNRASGKEEISPQ